MTELNITPELLQQMQTIAAAMGGASQPAQPNLMAPAAQTPRFGEGAQSASAITAFLVPTTCPGPDGLVYMYALVQASDPAQACNMVEASGVAVRCSKKNNKFGGNKYGTNNNRFGG